MSVPPSIQNVKKQFALDLEKYILSSKFKILDIIAGILYDNIKVKKINTIIIINDNLFEHT